MLKDVYHRHLKPRIHGFQATVAATPSASLGIGSMDATVARASQGLPTITPRYAFARRPVMVGCTNQATAGNGSYFAPVALPSATTLQGRFLNSGGGVVDSTGDIITLGWDSSSTDNCLQQSLVGSIRSPRIIAARIDGTNAVTLQGNKDILSVTRNTTGSYTVVFNRAFGRTPTIVVTGEGAAPRVATYSAKSPSQCTILTYDTAGTAADCIFHLVAYGQEGNDELGRLRRPVHASTLLRPTAFSLNAAGTSLHIGASDAAISGGVSKTGTGDFTITLRESFGKVPICVGSAITTRKFFVLNAPTSSAIRLATVSAGGGAVDVDCDLIVFGSDERGE